MPYNASLWAGFLARVGARYASATNLAFYSLAGEPACPNCRGDPLRPSTEELTAFYHDASAMLRRADPNAHHLISTGGLTQLDWAGGIDWRAIFALPHIDVAAIHAYDRARNGSGTNGMLALVPQLAALAHGLGKRFVLEEFGFDQSAFSAWDFDEPEAAAFDRVYSAARAPGVDGVAFWNLDECNIPPHGMCHNRSAAGASTFAVNPALPRVWAAVARNAPVSVGAKDPSDLGGACSAAPSFEWPETN